MIEAQQPQGEQPSSYLPAGPPEPLIFEEFEGINTATLRPGVDDKQAAWLDGFMPLSRRNLRTMYGASAPFYVAPNSLSVALFDFGNNGMVVVQSDGSIVQVAISTGVVTLMAPGGTIQNPSRVNVGMAQYGSKFIIIVAKQLNGYFLWDGTTFYFPGDPAPPGTGAPGATMPLAVSGTAVEVYAGRVWLASGSAIAFSAPGSVIDFSSASGGGNFTSVDSFLRVVFTQLKQTNGFLYLIADSSVNYISGVQTSGSPPVTTFTNQNADPEAGSPWPGTVDVFNRNILFANAFGAQISYGGAVTKISEALDGVYNTVPNFGNIIPSAAKAIIFGKKCWMMLLPIIDPVTGQQVNKLLLWNGKIWWASEQDVPLVYINFQEVASVLSAWGTDGKSIYRLFERPSIAFKKVAQSKLWDKPGGYQFTKFATRLWGIVKYYSDLSRVLNISIDNEVSSQNVSDLAPANEVVWLTDLDAVATWRNNSGAATPWLLNAVNAFSVFSPQAIAQSGVLTGFTISTDAADMAIVSIMIDGKIAGYRG